MKTALMTSLFCLLCSGAGFAENLSSSAADDSKLFSTPDAVVESYLSSLKATDLTSALNCFDFEYAYASRMLSVGRGPEALNKMIDKNGSEHYRKGAATLRELVSDRIESNFEVFKRCTTTIYSKWEFVPLMWVFVIRYELPDGRWAQPQILVAKTKNGWRIEEAHIPEFRVKNKGA